MISPFLLYEPQILCKKKIYKKKLLKEQYLKIEFTSGKHPLTFPRQKIKTATIIVQGDTVIQIVAHFVWTTRITLKVLTGAQNTPEFSLTNYSHAALRLAFHLERSTYVTHLKQTHYSKWAVELWKLYETFYRRNLTSSQKQKRGFVPTKL